MAGFKYLAITNLSYENIDGANKLFYKNRTINLTFLCDRTWSISAGDITNFVYKVKIWDNNNNIIYDSTSKQGVNKNGWTSLTNYIYKEKAYHYEVCPSCEKRFLHSKDKCIAYPEDWWEVKFNFKIKQESEIFRLLLLICFSLLFRK